MRFQSKTASVKPLAGKKRQYRKGGHKIVGRKNGKLIYGPE